MERDFGGRYVPETLVAALEQLEAAYDAVRHDPRFWAELDDLLVRYVGRPTPLYRADRLAADGASRGGAAGARPGSDAPRDPGDPALPQARGPRPHRRPQDQQRARPGAAHPAAGQDPGHRRDRRRPARRRDGDGVRAARPAVRRVHGRGGHPSARRPNVLRMHALGAEVRSVTSRHGHAQGRGQRGDARLGHERRDDALRARVGDGPAPVPDDRPRPPAADRRRGGGAARGRRGPAARTSRSRASAAARTRSGCCRGSSASRRSGSRSRRRPATASRPGGTRRRSRGGTPGILHGVAVADAPGPRRPGRRGALGVGRARLPGRRAAARGAGRGRPARGGDGDRPRGRGGDARGDPRPRASCRRSRRPTRSPRCPSSWPASRARARRCPTTRSSCSGSPAAATRTWPRSSGSPTSSRGTSADDDRRAARVLHVAARDAREGDLGRRRARGRRHVPGQGQDLPDHRTGRRRRDDPHDDRAAGRPHRRVSRVGEGRRVRRPVRLGRRRASRVEGALDPEVVRDVIRSAWRRTIPKSMLRELEAAGW